MSINIDWKIEAFHLDGTLLSDNEASALVEAVGDYSSDGVEDGVMHFTTTSINASDNLKKSLGALSCAYTDMKITATHRYELDDCPDKWVWINSVHISYVGRVVYNRTKGDVKHIREIDPAILKSKAEMLAILKPSACERTLQDMWDRNCEAFGQPLIWHYPFCDGDNLGGYIVQVKEGFLWLPYNEIREDDNELFLLYKARLLNVDKCESLMDEAASYCQSLVHDMQSMLEILKGTKA